MAVSTWLMCIVIVLFSFVFYKFWDGMHYWKKRGVPHNEPNWFFGNMQGVSTIRHMVDPINDLYTKFKGFGPFCGIYFFTNAGAVITDLLLIKKVLIKDFNNFMDRGAFYNEKDDPLSGHIFSLEGERWRTLRSKLSPTFSSGKMKIMFQSVLEVANRYVDVMKELVDKGNSITELKELNARFTSDVIGTCAFGLECNNLTDPNAQFRTYCRKVFEEPRHWIILAFLQACPNLARKLRMKSTTDEVEHFFMSVVKNTVEYREINNIKRNDFLSILIDLKNNEIENGGLTMNEVAAQTFLFFLAGFETSSGTMSHALFELAKHTEIQEKLRTEVNDVLTKHDGEFSYECLEDMTYMLQVFHETLRMYPVLPFLQRIAIDNYSTGGDQRFLIERGTSIFIPVQAIHMDPEIYPNPSKFDPDRFTPAEMNKRDVVTYMPFGEGPRKCIGIRFGKMQVRVGLALLIKNFKFNVCEKTQIPLIFDNKQMILQTADGIFLRVERI